MAKTRDRASRVTVLDRILGAQRGQPIVVPERPLPRASLGQALAGVDRAPEDALAALVDDHADDFELSERVANGRSMTGPPPLPETREPEPRVIETQDVPAVTTLHAPVQPRDGLGSGIGEQLSEHLSAEEQLADVDQGALSEPKPAKPMAPAADPAGVVEGTSDPAGSSGPPSLPPWMVAKRKSRRWSFFVNSVAWVGTLGFTASVLGVAALLLLGLPPGIKPTLLSLPELAVRGPEPAVPEVQVLPDLEP